MTKNYLSIISKPYAHLQTMINTSVKFRKNRHKTVGGVAHLKYLLLLGGQKDGRMESQRLRPSAFLRKGGGQGQKKDKKISNR